MSVFFTIQSTQPVIQFPSEAVAINGETIIISGEQFNKNIIKISGQNVYDPNSKFVFNGRFNENISGINNTLSLNTVGFTPSGLAPSKYRVSVYNPANLSTNYFNLKILNQPSISGFDNKNVLPGQYVKVSGSNLYPGANLLFVDSAGNKVRPSFQETGLYRVTGGDIQNYGTGYSVGNTFNLQGLKKYEENSYAVLTVSTIGISGSLGSFNINNSGIFTVPNLSSGIEFIPSAGNGRGALINFLYEKYENTGSLEFLEFQVPYNIRKNQSGILENLKFKGIFSGAKFTGFYISGYPNIHNFSPQTGLVDSTNIFISGDNLSFIQSLKIGDISVNSYSLVGDTGLSFKIPNFSSSNYIFVSGVYGSDKSSNLLDVSYPQLIASGYSPNDFLAGTGTTVTISGKYLQRINYINLGQPNVLRKDITVNQNATLASFTVPNAYTTTSLKIFSVDFPTSGHLIKSASSNDLLISTTRLSEANVNIRYLSGIQAAKYLDEMEIYTPSGTSGDYGNLTNSDVFFLGITGYADTESDYIISGIKINNSATGIRFRVPREVRNPQARIKIKRNLFRESYILPSNKSIDVLPTIYDITSSNTLYNSLGYLTISGINASNVNLIYFSGYAGTKNILGYKEIKNLPLTIVNKNLTQIAGVNGIGGSNNGYSIFEAKLGGDITGSGELFLFNSYYDTGIGYENDIITKNKNIKVSAISGFRPPNSDIFTISPYVAAPLETPFFYKIQTNSRATRFELSSTTSSGIGDGIFPTGINNFLNSRNEIFGITPSFGGSYYLKIRALDGEKPNEGMILTLSVGGSGRALNSPGITYRGLWSSTVPYVATSLRRDVVRYTNGPNYWYAAYTNINSEPGLDNSDWIPFSNEFSSTATKILVAEDSTITSSLNIGEYGTLSGYIKTPNDENVDIGSGFFLGFDNRYNYGLPKFRVGNEDGYIKFDGVGLDINGPLSGIVTSSRNIKDANNIVDSNNSLAVGQDNYVNKDTENVFIFGSNNNTTGARRSSILGGRYNSIMNIGTSNWSVDSSIVGGEFNKIIGSYSTINGGLGNSINSTTTGLGAFSTQIFKTSVNYNQLTPIACIYPGSVFDSELVITNNIETSRISSSYQNPIYRSKNYSNPTPQALSFDLYPTAQLNEKLKIHSWLSSISDNLFSGSFSGLNSKVCEFKVGKTGVPTGIKRIRINFKKPFVNYTSNDLILLEDTVTSGSLSFQNGSQQSSHRITDISGLNISGFSIEFPDSLDKETYVSYRVGPTGFYSGVGYNEKKSLEINRIQPFKNLISGSNGSYDLSLTKDQICFAQGNKYFYKSGTHKGNYGNYFCLSGASSLKSEIFSTINPNVLNYNADNQYYNVSMLGFTGSILNNNIQIWQTGALFHGWNWDLKLPSGFTNRNQYVPMYNLYTTGNSGTTDSLNTSLYDTYRLYMKSGGASAFRLDALRLYDDTVANPAGRPFLFNLAVFRTGNYSFDNCNFEVKRILISIPPGGSNPWSSINLPQDISFDRSFNTKPTVFISIDQDGYDNVWTPVGPQSLRPVLPQVGIKQILTTGIKLYESGAYYNLSGWSSYSIPEIYLNYIAIAPSGTQNSLELKDSIVIDKNLNFSGNIDFESLTYFDNPSITKVFGKTYSKNNSYIHNAYQNSSNSFGLHVSDKISVDILTGLTYEYMISDLETDFNSSQIALELGEYNRIALYGFSDIGSSTIGGGTGNYIEGVVSTIGGGVKNKIIGDFNLIPGGRANLIEDHDFSAFNLYPQVAFCSILGGSNNSITGNVKYNNILGGQSNVMKNDNEFTEYSYSTILGGYQNIVSGAYSNVFGGIFNIISGDYNNLLGSGNKINGSFSNIFGHNNKINGYNNALFGNNSDITGSGIFYFSDSLTGPNRSIKVSNTMVINMSGGLIITGASPSIIRLDINSLKTNLTTGTEPITPIGGIYRSGNFLCIRTV